MKKRNLAESSELLRMALPLMAKYKIPVVPENYLVWYEYVSGDNPDLKTRMDSIIKSNGLLNEEVTISLLRNYLDGESGRLQTENAQQALLTISKDVEAVLKTACGEASTYEASLTQYQGKINSSLEVEQLSELIGELSNATSNMNNRNKELIEDLAVNRKETEKLREELVSARKEAKTDPLTLLSNRAALLEYFEKINEVSEQENAQHCLLFADIDKFKFVNDTYGHIFGDKVIKAVAKILKDNTKGKDFPARFGGEEFVVLLPYTNIDGAISVAETIRKTMESARIKKPGTGEVLDKITLSIGVTSLVFGDSIEKALSHADAAMYQAKNEGRNRVILYSE